MNKSAVLFALSSLLLGSLGAVALGYDDDPGYGPERPMFGGVDRNLRPILIQPYGMSDRQLQPLYYKPTMRYYGNGYVVSYRYVPIYRGDAMSSATMGESSNFRTESFRLSPEEVAKWGANSPRVTTKDTSSNGPRTAVTAIVRKKTTGKTSSKSKIKDEDPAENPEPPIVPKP